MTRAKLPPVEPTPRRRRGGPPLDDFAVPLVTTTPLLGGGVRTREVDSVTPIRTASIRGHLRFWWRALHVHEVADGRELAAREAALWGAMGQGGSEPQRSAVEVWVTEVEPSGVDSNDITFRDKGAYALWPAREERRNRRAPAKRWRSGLRFHLHVRAPHDALSEIERAVRAWLLFGGLGGRTRRGVGSLGLVAASLPADAQRAWLPTRLSASELTRLLGPIALTGPDHGDIPEPRETPGLHGASLLYGKTQKDGDTAWYDALGWLRDFRQKAPRNTRSPDEYARRAPPPEATNKRPGRSNWPEADKVRILNGANTNWAHEIRYPDSTPAWPRAGFGLPIVGQFQSKDRSDCRYEQPGEPPNFELRWRDCDKNERTRLGSPLIVKAVALTDGEFVPVALWLHRAYPPGGQVFLWQNNRPVPASEAPFDRLLGPNDQGLYEPLSKSSLREAFCTWLAAQSGVRQVTP
ncbi:type III-B CRISPR module RAMP protein Cmr1 [Haliangium sp.]|uniref:type III-B CRISPR module RAMP protein Cmr1 n=1 Tax=Haliangium sp. TaxID=2663208 RepID=UPI003D123DEF